MKIYKTTQFEKFKINPININVLSSTQKGYSKITEYTDTVVLRKRLDNGISEYCMYSFLGPNNIPKNMGKLLDDYGAMCDYAIRPKEWDTDINTLLDDDIEYYVIDVYWVTQDAINDMTTQNALMCMFDELVNICNVTDIEVYFFCGCRDNYSIKGVNPDIIFKYDPEIRETYVYNEN